MIQFINMWCPSWGWLKTLDLRYQKQIRQNVILRELKKCTFFELFRNCTEYIWIWEKTHSKSDAIEPFWTYNELLIWASFTILLCNWSRVSCVTVCTAPGHDLWSRWPCGRVSDVAKGELGEPVGRTPVGTTTALWTPRLSNASWRWMCRLICWGEDGVSVHSPSSCHIGVWLVEQRIQALMLLVLMRNEAVTLVHHFDQVFI